MREERKFKIPVAEPLRDKDVVRDELKFIGDAVKSRWLSTGKYIGLFEERFSEFCGTNFAVSVNTGTAALQLALATLRVGRGDEVIVPTLTFTATADVVKLVGAEPVFVDSELETWNIDPGKIEEKITPRTRAIIPVHLYGHPADMDPILAIAKRHNLLVIEDAAEAHGALYKGKKVGSIGDIGCFSLFGNKIITTGEGGMLVTNNEDIFQRASFLRNQAQDPNRKYWHPEIGFNFRMTNIHAAVGFAQLLRIERIIEKKREIAKLYNELLGNVDELTLPPEMPWAKNVYWMYSVLINGDRQRRDRIMDELKKKGIETRNFFYPISIMPQRESKERFPVAEDLSARGINLPSSPNLTTRQIRYICRSLKEILKNA